jgi:hypothetical protein
MPEVSFFDHVLRKDVLWPSRDGQPLPLPDALACTAASGKLVSLAEQAALLLLHQRLSQQRLIRQSERALLVQLQFDNVPSASAATSSSSSSSSFSSSYYSSSSSSLHSSSAFFARMSCGHVSLLARRFAGRNKYANVFPHGMVPRFILVSLGLL